MDNVLRLWAFRWQKILSNNKTKPLSQLHNKGAQCTTNVPLKFLLVQLKFLEHLVWLTIYVSDTFFIPYLDCFSKGFVMIDRVAIRLDGDLLLDACLHHTVPFRFVLKKIETNVSIATESTMYTTQQYLRWLFQRFAFCWIPSGTIRFHRG